MTEGTACSQEPEEGQVVKKRFWWRCAALGLALMIGFPLTMQLHLLISISPLGVLWPLLLPLIGLILIALAVAGGVYMAIAERRWPITKRHVASTLLPLYLLGCLVVGIPAGEMLVAKQRTWNDRRGLDIVAAVRTHKDLHGRYPHSKSELVPELLRTWPRFQHGLLKVDFIYWMESGKPELKYCSGLWTGRIYDFEAGEWSDDTL